MGSFRGPLEDSRLLASGAQYVIKKKSLTKKVRHIHRTSLQRPNVSQMTRISKLKYTNLFHSRTKEEEWDSIGTGGSEVRPRVSGRAQDGVHWAGFQAAQTLLALPGTGGNRPHFFLSPRPPLLAKGKNRTGNAFATAFPGWTRGKSGHIFIPPHGPAISGQGPSAQALLLLALRCRGSVSGVLGS